MAEHVLPIQPTPFVGRDAELSEITGILADPACRLLTLIGPGGVGKTRLAIEATSHLGEAFSDGVYFVDLISVTAENDQAGVDVAAVIADVLPVTLSGRQPPRIQLCSYLRDKEMLVLLDNFEHLLAAATYLNELLAQAPSVKLLVTSREAINLQSEWLYPLHGLPVPLDSDAGNLADYGAVQLFLERARRLQPEFALAEEREGVARICRLVGGSPLALELAASWLKVLSCSAIADEIEQNINFLSANLRDVPERHRSMQAVFAQTWQLLGEEERDVFMRLSVFRGDFERPAAEEVAGASLPILLGLVDKSVIRRENGRYHLHKLLRQYAQKKLAASPQAKFRSDERHCSYYADFLRRRFGDLLGGRQREATAEIEAALNNIRTAWQWAVAQVRLEHLQKASQPLALFYQFQCRFLEGARMLSAAALALQQEAATKSRDLALLPILMDQAWLAIRLGRLAEADSLLVDCREIYRRQQISPVSGHGTDPALAQGIIASIRGDHAAAVQMGEEAHRRSEADAHLWNKQFATYLLSRAALAQGRYDAARKYALQAYHLTQETADLWFMAYCHNELGNVARALGEYDEARQHYEASFKLRESFADPEGMALALTHLGETAVLQKKYEQAQRLFKRSRDIYAQIDDRGGLATALKGLGQAAIGLGQYRNAQTRLREALQIAADIPFMRLIFSLLLAIGEWWLQTERPKRGLSLLAFARHHPAADQSTKEAAARLLHRYETAVSGELRETAVQQGRESDLKTITDWLLATLALPPEVLIPSTESDEELSLADSLTPRELEVLQLLAQGLTNREIAAELTVVEGTVKAHNHNIYSKLTVDNRTEAVARARELGLI